MSALGDSWTDAEDETIFESFEEGLAWVDIAPKLPGRSLSACRARAGWLANNGYDVEHRDRAPLRGRGTGAGRPKNKEPSVKLPFRLHTDTSAAFRTLAKATSTKPGALLCVALERLAKNGRKRLSERGSGDLINQEADRVAVCWGVPTAALEAAYDRWGTGSCDTAEAAVIGLLKAHGYRVSE